MKRLYVIHFPDDPPDRNRSAELAAAARAATQGDAHRRGIPAPSIDLQVVDLSPAIVEALEKLHRVKVSAATVQALIKALRP